MPDESVLLAVYVTKEKAVQVKENTERRSINLSEFLREAIDANLYISRIRDTKNPQTTEEIQKCVYESLLDILSMPRKERIKLGQEQAPLDPKLVEALQENAHLERIIAQLEEKIKSAKSILPANNMMMNARWPQASIDVIIEVAKALQ
jgi:hypothetical protein